MSMFSGIKDAKATLGGNYIDPGQHVLEIGLCKADQSRKGENLFILEAVIRKSEGGVDNDGKDVPAHKPGEHVSWVVNLTKHDAALGNVKAFISAVMGIEADEVTEELAMKVVDEDEQPFAGLLVRVEAIMTKTKAGNDFTRLNWFNMDEAEVAALEAA